MGDSHEQSEDKQGARVLKPYEPPKVADTASFETLAMTCGKTDGGFCAFNGGLSNS